MLASIAEEQQCFNLDICNVYETSSVNIDRLSVGLSSVLGLFFLCELTGLPPR